MVSIPYKGCTIDVDRLTRLAELHRHQKDRLVDEVALSLVNVGLAHLHLGDQSNVSLTKDGTKFLSQHMETANTLVPPDPPNKGYRDTVLIIFCVLVVDLVAIVAAGLLAR